MNVGLFTQYPAEEFDIKLLESNDTTKMPKFQLMRREPGLHNMNTTTRSILLLSNEMGTWIFKVNDWLGELLAKKGYRRNISFKGFISIVDDPERFVFKSTCMLL